MDHEKRLDIMQSNLLSIRKALNLSARELGEKIGVTRQTINNIEFGRNKLHKTQYLALLYVLYVDIFPTLTTEEINNICTMLVQKKLNRIHKNTQKHIELRLRPLFFFAVKTAPTMKRLNKFRRVFRHEKIYIGCIHRDGINNELIRNR